MPLQPQEIQIHPADKSSRARIAAVVLVLIAIAAILLFVQWAKEKDSIPRALILDSRAEILYDEKSGNRYVKFESDKSGEELVRFYKDRLSGSGWSFQVDKNLSNNSSELFAHRLFAKKDKYLMNIVIQSFLDETSDKSQRTVSIHLIPFREGIEYR